MTALEIKTKSALSDEVKEFLKQYKDRIEISNMLNKSTR